MSLHVNTSLGIRKRRPRCVRVIDGQLVSNSRCDQSTRPSTVTEDCNISCRLRWVAQLSTKACITTVTLASENRLHFTTSPLVSTGFPAKWRLGNKRRNFISITCYYLNLCCTSDWLKHISLAARPIISTTHIWLVARYQYGISAFGPQTSFHGETSGVDGKGQLFSHATLTSVDDVTSLKPVSTKKCFAS